MGNQTVCSLTDNDLNMNRVRLALGSAIAVAAPPFVLVALNTFDYLSAMDPYDLSLGGAVISTTAVATYGCVLVAKRCLRIEPKTEVDISRTVASNPHTIPLVDTYIPEEVPPVTVLPEKAVDYEKIKKFKPDKAVTPDDSWVYFENLEELDLSNHPFEPESWEFILGILGLKILRLSNAQLKEIPPGIAKLKNLEVLDVARNDIKEFPPLPVSIKEVDLSHNKIAVLPMGIHDLLNLKQLNMSSNTLTPLDETIFTEANHYFNLDLRECGFNQLEKARLRRLTNDFGRYGVRISVLIH